VLIKQSEGTQGSPSPASLGVVQHITLPSNTKYNENQEILFQ
jgi:hypothetical protein